MLALVLLLASVHRCLGWVVTAPVQHGEGPYWSDKEQVLYYVDTFKATIYRVKPGDHQVTTQEMGGKSVGVIFPIKHQPHKFIVGHDRLVSIVTWDGQQNNTGNIERVAEVHQDKPTNQFNDGKIDSLGRMWAGTLTRNADLGVTNFGGALFSFTGNNIQQPTIHIQNVSISNGIAWSKDNKNMYYIDSETRKVVGYDFNLQKGEISNERVVFDLADHPNLLGIPDGMTIDDKDNIYVALFGGKAVIKVDPKKRKLLKIIDIPATYVTSATFGGPKLTTLFVTTSRLKLTDEEILKEPYAGSVFALNGLNARGLPSNEFIYKKSC